MIWDDEEEVWVDSSTYLAINQCGRCKKFGHWKNECPEVGGSGKKTGKSGKGKFGKPDKGKDLKGKGADAKNKTADG